MESYKDRKEQRPDRGGRAGMSDVPQRRNPSDRPSQREPTQRRRKGTRQQDRRPSQRRETQRTDSSQRYNTREQDPARHRRREQSPAPPQRRGQEQADRPKREKGTQKKRRKRTKRFSPGKFFDNRFNVRLFTTLAIVAALVLCCIVFFRVSKISVAGNAKYSQQEIIAASGIEPSDALLLVNKSSAASRIMAKLPYIDHVRIGTTFPNTVRIEVTELETAYAVVDEVGSYWLINCQGRVVESIEGKAAADYLTVTGVQIQVPKVGDTVQAAKASKPSEEPKQETSEDEEQTTSEDEGTAPQIDTSTPKERLETALEILSYLDTYNETKQITSLDVSNLLDIRILYGTQYEVCFGAATELDYKVEYMIAAVAQLDEYESGTLDLTFAEERVARFLPWSD